MKRIYASGGGVGKKSGGFSSAGNAPGTTNRITKYTNGPAGIIGDSQIEDIPFAPGFPPTQPIIRTDVNVMVALQGQVSIGPQYSNPTDILNIMEQEGIAGTARIHSVSLDPVGGFDIALQRRRGATFITPVDTVIGDYFGSITFRGFTVNYGGIGELSTVDGFKLIVKQTGAMGVYTSVAADLIFQAQGLLSPTTGFNEVARITAAGQLLIGNTGVTQGNFGCQITQLNENETGFEALAYSTTNTKTGAMVFCKSHANTAIKGNTVDTEQLGAIRFKSTNGVAFRQALEIGVFQEGAASDLPGSYLSITSYNGISYEERLRFNASGQLLINHTAAISDYKLQIASLNVTNNGAQFVLYSTDTAKYSKLVLAKSAQNTIGYTNTGIGDLLGAVEMKHTFNGAFYEAFEIQAVQTGAAEANAEAALTFITNAGSVHAERYRFDGIGRFSITRQNSTIVECITLYNLDTTAANGNNIIFRTTTINAGASAGMEMARVEAMYTIHDHATRAAELNFFITIAGSAKKAIRCRPTSNGGHVQFTCGNANPGSGDNQTVTMYLDESGNTLKFRVVYGGGTVKSGTVALV
jgi:hypothetical protein